MAATFVRPELSINRRSFQGAAFSTHAKLVSDKSKGAKIQSSKFRLDRSILEPDSQITYLEFLERNPLRLSMQRLNGRMEHRIQRKLDFDRIEESYWSHWKPNKNGIFIEAAKIENKRSIPKSQTCTRGEGDRNYNNKKEETEMVGRYALEFKQSEHLSKIDEVTEDDRDLDASSSMSNVEEAKTLKFLRHTDSFILNSKKQSEEKPHYQQPRCIRLYKKNSTGSYIKGGSYPLLKPCLKKESTFKGYTRRPLSATPHCASMFKSSKNKMKPK